MSRRQSVNLILTGFGLMAFLTGLALCFFFPVRMTGPGLLALSLGVGAWMIDSLLEYRVFSKEKEDKSRSFKREVFIGFASALQFCAGFLLSLHLEFLGPVFVLISVAGIFGTVYDVIHCFE